MTEVTLAAMMLVYESALAMADRLANQQFASHVRQRASKGFSISGV
jgi:hypothetical protein